jgi:possible relaxase
MEKQKLTLENFDDLALELLKKENDDSTTLYLEWEYETFTEEDIEKLRKIKDKTGEKYLGNTIDDFLLNKYTGHIEDTKDYLIEKILYEYVDKENEDYLKIKEKLKEKLYDEVSEKFQINANGEEILRNTNVGEVIIYLCKDQNKTMGDLALTFDDYIENPNDLKYQLEEDEFNPMVFLIQSQGYEMEDLYNDEKVKSSPFLSSLKEKMEEYSGGNWSFNIGFSKEDVFLDDLIYLEETDRNIVISKNDLDKTFNDIKLEKDIILNKNDIRIVSDYSVEKEEECIYTIGYTLDKNKDLKFTNEKGFEIHEVDIEKVYKMAIIDLSKEDYENFIEKYSLDDKEELEVELGRLENKNKSMSGDLVAFKEDVKEMQGQLLNYLEDKGYIEKTEDNNYHISKETLDEDNFETIKADFVNEFSEYKNDIFLNNFTLEDLVERFDLKMPDFKIYSKDEKVLYDSEKKYDFLSEVRNIVIDTKGEEYWDNMNLKDVKDWEDLLQSKEVIGVISRNSEQFDNYVDYSCDIFEEGKIYDKIQNELSVYADELRIDLKGNSKNNVITKENLDKLKEKYRVDDFEPEYKDDEKIEKDDKEIEM